MLTCYFHVGGVDGAVVLMDCRIPLSLICPCDLLHLDGGVEEDLGGCNSWLKFTNFEVNFEL